MSNRYVYGGLVFVKTCRSHPEQYDVQAEGGHKVGFVHYRRNQFTVHGSDWFNTSEYPPPLLTEERDSNDSEWPGNRIAPAEREVWLTEAAELIHADMRAARCAR